MKTISIKLKNSGSATGPFDIKDDLGNLLGENIAKEEVIVGVSFVVSDSVKVVYISSKSGSKKVIAFPIESITIDEFEDVEYEDILKASSWRHLKNPTLLNSFYGTIHAYVIEYPFSYPYHDQILQSVEDYTKAYIYHIEEDGEIDFNNRIEVDDEWFNKAVLYNNQQSSGVLNLVPKPMNKMKEYMKYPIIQSDSKSILYTKLDNFYQYNTFWSLVKDRTKPLFITSCSSLSIDKEVNQENMDYSARAFRKDTLRAKDLKIRHVLDNKTNVLLVSQFILSQSQISY